MKQTVSQAIVFAFGLAILLICPFYAAKAQHSQFEPVSDEIKNRFNDRQKRIKQELASLQGNEWAGAYYASESSINGALFIWSPANGFTIRSGNEFHRGVEKINYGGVNFNGNLLTLSPEFTEKSKHTYSIPTSFLPVKWDEQHWLIPSDELILFIYAVNSGDFEEMESFFVKLDDQQKPNEGLPDVPGEYRRYLKLKPIKASVTTVKGAADDYLTSLSLELNIGKNNGVIKGMKLYLINLKGVSVKIEVTDVSESTSTARMVSYGSSGDYNKEIKPAAGWKFSSRMPRNY